MQQTKLPQLGYYMCFSAKLPDYGQTVAEIVLDAIEALHLTGNVEAYAGNHPISGEYGFAIVFHRQNGAKWRPKEWWMPLSKSVSQLCQTNGQIQFLTHMSELAEIDNIRDVAEGQGTISVSMGRPTAIRDDIESLFINEAKSRIATTQPDGCSSMKEPSYKQNTDPSLLFAEKLIRTMPPAIYQIIVKAGNVGLAYENQSWINSCFVTVVRNDTQVLHVAKLGNQITKEGSFESRDSYQIITAILQCDVETMLLKQHEMTTDAWDKLQEIGSTEYCNGAYKCMLALRLPHMKKRDKSLAILYSLGDAINIVHQTNTGRARKQELGDRSFKG